MAKHIILRQIIELDTIIELKDQHTLAEELSQLAHNQIVDKVGEVLDLFDVPTHTLYIDRIDITLESHPGESIESVIRNQLGYQLQQAMSKASQDAKEPISLAETDIGIGLFFLERGYLPWNASADLTLPELERRLMALLPDNDAFLQKLTLLLKQPSIRQRFFQQFSHQVHWQVALEIIPVLRLSTIREQVDRLWQKVGSTERLLLWNTLFEQPETVQQLLKSGNFNELSQRSPNAPEAVDSTDQTNAQHERIEENGIFLKNAGLVLLHPFLGTLFSNRKLRNENYLTDPERAVGLLHYAVSGQTTAAEWELPLVKILCGLDISEPLPSEFDLSHSDKEEVETMLRIVIKRWPILKNSSSTWLRENFLQHEGCLARTANGWHLKINQGPIDMLLDHLTWYTNVKMGPSAMLKHIPWDPSVVIVPWMTTSLSTEW